MDNQARQSSYYLAHRTEILAKKKAERDAHRLAHPEQHQRKPRPKVKTQDMQAYQHAWYLAHRDELYQRQKQRREADRETYLLKQRAYYQAHADKWKTYAAEHRDQIKANSRRTWIRHKARYNGQRRLAYAVDNTTVRRRNKAWYEAHKIQHREAGRRWAAEHRPQVNASARKWAAAHPTQKRETARSYAARQRAANPALARKKEREWRAKNPEKARAADWRSKKRHYAAILAYNRTRALIQRRASTGQKFTLLDIATRDHWRCHLCKRKVTRKTWTLDHLIPVIHGGAHTSINVALAHRSCNSSRGAGRLPAQLLLLP